MFGAPAPDEPHVKEGNPFEITKKKSDVEKKKRKVVKSKTKKRVVKSNTKKRVAKAKRKKMNKVRPVPKKKKVVQRRKSKRVEEELSSELIRAISKSFPLQDSPSYCPNKIPQSILNPKPSTRPKSDKNNEYLHSLISQIINSCPKTSKYPFVSKFDI